MCWNMRNGPGQWTQSTVSLPWGDRDILKSWKSWHQRRHISWLVQNFPTYHLRRLEQLCMTRISKASKSYYTILWPLGVYDILHTAKGKQVPSGTWSNYHPGRIRHVPAAGIAGGPWLVLFRLESWPGVRQTFAARYYKLTGISIRMSGDIRRWIPQVLSMLVLNIPVATGRAAGLQDRWHNVPTTGFLTRHAEFNLAKDFGFSNEIPRRVPELHCGEYIVNSYDLRDHLAVGSLGMSSFANSREVKVGSRHW